MSNKRRLRLKEKKTYTPFPPPQQPSKEPRKMDTKSEDDNKDMGHMVAKAMSLKKKAEEFGKQKSVENVETEAYIATAGEPSKKKSKGAESRA
uniref:Uncharacterized protein n=1 Tax=Quercus lobata TaxID=97700 RepID=A0A7N2KLX5_QUELO